MRRPAPAPRLLALLCVSLFAGGCASDSVGSAAAADAGTAPVASLDGKLASIVSAIQQLDGALLALQRYSNEQSETIRALTARLGEVEAASAAGPCSCAALPADTLTVGSPGSPRTELLVGTPRTGFVNGVNVAALASEAVRNSGTQTIAGTLAVQSLTVGDWTLEPTTQGLALSSPQGGVLLQPDAVQLGGVTVAGNAGVLSFSSPTRHLLSLGALPGNASVPQHVLSVAGAAVFQDSVFSPESGEEVVGVPSGAPLATRAATSGEGGWCDCYRARFTPLKDNDAGVFVDMCANKIAVDVSCRPGYFMAQLQATTVHSVLDTCRATGDGVGVQCCRPC